MEQLKILVVRSVNRGISTFIEEQVNSLREIGVAIEYFNIEGKGRSGYLSNVLPLWRRVWKADYHLVHAHVGLSGLVANLQRYLPVITTFHGTDVELESNAKYSKMAARLSAYTILTNKRLNDILKLSNNYAIIPCGVDLDNFKPMDRQYCKQKMRLTSDKNYILFSSSFSRREKNAGLAKQAVQQLENTELIELKGYSRSEVNLLINASRLVLMTSHYESAPLIIKEALACNRPVVSTDVGDVSTVVEGIEGSYVVQPDAADIVDKCRRILNSDENFRSRSKVMKYNLPVIAKRIKNVYKEVLQQQSAAKDLR